MRTSAPEPPRFGLTTKRPVAGSLRRAASTDAALEHDDEPTAAPRYRQLPDLGALPPLIREIDPRRS